MTDMSAASYTASPAAVLRQPLAMMGYRRLATWKADPSCESNCACVHMAKGVRQDSYQPELPVESEVSSQHAASKSSLLESRRDTMPTVVIRLTYERGYASLPT
ncbi:predicted protein [Verticillium alfalfae VaMs.102]|uniref:Predicted protein n=1 Tax=Verticillium alfalfae (strain VaMs.102 / ATCC MYA-4576 / FGSC 10136) TaxID=526221 RepID=C9SPL5_VERA1|nr:predicted protein [Verticillium alfalfae VaMs.102]EEY20730.1 predicted protein [Verticillium alfalfae VaMs.102]